ncbi:hypothetical protein EBZ39_18205 [bacterium]|nr:hypothetical protein [bacterium]
MERQQSQKERSVAWFKLADLIARGEREKALSVFRLLSHSLADKAYVLQIEGDILWYMDDTASIEKYRQAATLYQKEKRWINAIALQEHVLAMRPDSFEPLATLLLLYALVDWQEKFLDRFNALLALHDQRLVDGPQLEKALRDLAEVVRQGGGKPWLATWYAQNQHRLPSDMQTRVSGLF